MLLEQTVPAYIGNLDSPKRTKLGKLEIVRKLSSGASNAKNLIIQGENLAVLAALLPQYAGKVKCVYIDPPYNNKERYTHYDDDLDHLTWLKKLKKRIALLRDFLTPDGSLWISVDDREVHYLKVAADEIFDRKNFVTTVIWQQRTTRENRRVFSNNHEYVLVFAKDVTKFSASRNGLPINDEIRARYKNPDNDPRGPWQSVSANVQAGHGVASQFYGLTGPKGHIHTPPKGRCWVYNKSKMKEEIKNNNIWFGAKGDGVPRIKRFLSSRSAGLTPETLWFAKDVGTSCSAKKHLLSLFPDEEVFDTPKPEALIERILSIATNPADLVLDAYLGSGTTAVVAQRTGRRYIGIEEGSHIVDYCVQRLRAIISESSTKKSTHQGFCFYRLK